MNEIKGQNGRELANKLLKRLCVFWATTKQLKIPLVVQQVQPLTLSFRREAVENRPFWWELKSGMRCRDGRGWPRLGGRT